ncbi:MAG: ribbon-helix-helix domain-containing protein [Verrucomicrobiales bacterium]|jgi:predicted CopG family antitoxin|nr:ribbon-helix-helix domain-containing protein [Verrucomicrobiales bacterium]
MVRTQIQLPEEMYAELKALAKEREISIAELIRRGAEYMLDILPRLKNKKPRAIPVFDLGPWRGLSHAELKEIAQKTATEERLMEEMQRPPQKAVAEKI